MGSLKVQEMSKPTSKEDAKLLRIIELIDAVESTDPQPDTLLLMIAYLRDKWIRKNRELGRPYKDIPLET